MSSNETRWVYLGFQSHCTEEREREREDFLLEFKSLIPESFVTLYPSHLNKLDLRELLILVDVANGEDLGHGLGHVHIARVHTQLVGENT